MSSIAGIVPIPFQLWYSVSKAAIIAYVLALQNEVRPFGISVCAIMPGDIASGFTDARRKSAAGDDVYAGRIERSVAVMEHDERTGMTREARPGEAGAKKAALVSTPLLVRDGLTLADVRLETGRRHQIRVQHLLAGLPLWGDARYGGGRPGQQIALWAHSLTFEHPTLKTPVAIESLPPPEGAWRKFPEYASKNSPEYAKERFDV